MMGYQILHIEDSQSDADLVKRLIVKSGIEFSYQLASNEREVTAALDSFKPDVILCDHSLPTFNSRMAYDLCKEKSPDLTFILVTGTISEEFAVEMLRAGVDDYLLKSNLLRLPLAIENAYSKRVADRNVEAFRNSLQESETHLRTIFQNSASALILIDRNYIILELNDRTKLYNKISFGRELEKNKNLLESMPVYRRDEMQKNINKSFQGKRIKYESVYPQSDGSSIIFAVKLNPTINEFGLTTGVCITFDDISEQKKVENALKESELFNRSILASIDYHMAVINANGDILTTNKAWNDFSIQNGETDLNRTGIGSNYLAVCKASAEAGDSLALAALNGFQQVINKEIPFFEMEYPCHSKDKRRWYLLRIVNFVDDSQKVVMMNIDISDLKQSTIQTQNLNNRLQLASSSAGMGIWEWDIKNNRLLWDEGMYRLYDIEPDYFDELYESWLSMLHPQDQKSVKKEIQMAVTGEKQYDSEFRIILPDSTIRFIKATCISEKDENGKIVRLIGLNWDITDQKNDLIQKVKTANELIKRNNNLEQFSYIISHNLRAPVANILGLANIWNLTSLGDEEKDELAVAMYESANRIDTVVKDLNQILQVSNDVMERKEEILFSKIVEEIEVEIKTLIEADNIEIKCDFSKIDAFLTLKSYMYSIFHNLITNSIKFRQLGKPCLITIKSNLEDNKLLLVFTDNGLGIDLQSCADEIFGLYNRFHAHVEGKGIGLFIVKAQVEKLGGEISVKSEVNKGTEFKIEFEL